jgi:hypothetical protein
MKKDKREIIEDIIIVIAYLCLTAFILVMVYVATKVLYMPQIKESCMIKVNNGNYENVSQCIEYELKHTYFYNYYNQN